MTGADFKPLGKDPSACFDIVDRRLDALEAREKKHEESCRIDGEDDGLRALVDVTSCLFRLPVGERANALYARTAAIGKGRSWSELDCLSLAALHQFWVHFPLIFADLMPALEPSGPTDCAAKKDAKRDAPYAPKAFPKWLFAEPARLKRAARVTKTAGEPLVPIVMTEAEAARLNIHVSIGTWSGVAFVDTGGGSFMAMSGALARILGVRGEPIGETLGMCVDCSPSSLRAGWVDSIVLGDKKATDVPVLVLDDPAEPLMIGAPLLRALGGMTIVWNGKQPSLAFGPPSGCDRALPTFIGPHAHLFVRAELGALGTPVMVFDTGMPVAYTFDPADLAKVPPSWKQVTQTDPGPTLEYVASLPAPDGSHAVARTARRFRDGAQHTDFPGAKSYASHLAFAPLRTCITFDAPAVSVKAE